MAFRFMMSGGNFLASVGGGASGISISHNGSITSSAPAGGGDTYAIFSGIGSPNYGTPNLGGNFQSLAAGLRIYLTAIAGGQVIVFTDQSGNNQCDLRMNGTGQLFFTRNGTIISGFSAATIPINAWTYVEFEAIFSTTGAGTCIARINGVTVLSATGVTDATTAPFAAAAILQAPGSSSAYAKDFYVLDGGAAAAPFTLTSVDNAGNFSGTITGGAGNAYVGYKFTITGFTNGANNPVGAICTGSTATTLSFSYLTTVTETHAGTVNNYGATGLQGDLKVVELYPDGPGSHSAWAQNVGPFSITSVAAASGGNQVFTGTITGGGSNAYVGYNFVTSGFANAVNNSGANGFICVASSATSLTLVNPSGVADTTGSANFQAITQIGINQTGTRPNGDVAYLSDATPGDISDFAHTALTLTGAVLGVAHLSYLRKDDAGTRQVAQVCISGATTEQSPPESLGNNYQYWVDFLDVDPHTASGWLTGNLNAATFGVKELT